MSAVSDEVKLLRVLAILEEEFGPVGGARPKLSLLAGGRDSTRAPSEAQDTAPRAQPDETMVCRLKALIRKEWPDEFKAKPRLTLIHGGRGA